MANGIYSGVDGVARKVKTPYIGVDGVARKVTTSYIGVDGVARKCYQGGPPPLDKASWADISEIAASGEAQNYWAVGDCKAVNINGTVGQISINDTYYVYIIGFNHNGATNTIDFGTFKTAAEGGVDVCLVDSKYGDTYGLSGTVIYFNLNHGGGGRNAGGWKGCDFRYDVLGSVDKAPSGYRSSSSRSGYDASTNCATNPVSGTLIAAFPSDLRAVMKPMTIYTDNTGGGDTYYKPEYVTASVDYLPLPAPFEFYGDPCTSNPGEKNYQARYTYYSEGNSRLKYRHDDTTTAVYYWTRSPYFDNSNAFVVFDSINSYRFGSSHLSYGVTPIFRV